MIPHFSFSALPTDAKLHNLLSLAAKDVAITDPPETTGSSLLVQHQRLMMEHYGHKHMAVLPEDVIQRLLLGVSSQTHFSFTLSILTTVLIKAAPTESFTVLFLLSFQSTHTLELTLHLEQKVIKLKQDAL